MSCKENFSLFDFDEQLHKIKRIPLPINDELMSFASEDQQMTPETNFDILLNKHLNNHEITDIQLQQLPEHERNTLVQIQNKGQTKKKRADQCQKLFYKKAFKYSQNKFFKRCKNKSRKMSHFYHHHFDLVCKTEGFSITHFYHPNKKTKPGLTLGHKTFNNKYIKLLFKSKTFLEDIRQYHKIFIDDCLKQRRKKVISFTKSIQRIMERAKEDSRVLVQYLQSSQCKIPWTYSEIKQSWDIAQRDLEEFFEPDAQIQMTNKGQQQMQQEQIEISLGQNSQKINDLN